MKPRGIVNFTLIEVVVALALLSVSLAGLLQLSINSQQKLITADDKWRHEHMLAQAAEYLMLGMRTVRGISPKEYHSIYRSDFTPLQELLEEYERKGWAVQENGRWHFTPSGFLLSNLLIRLMLDKQGEYKLSGNPWVDSMDMFLEQTELPAGEEVFYH